METAKEAAKSVAELQTTLVESLEGDADQAPVTEGEATVTRKLDAAETKGEAEDKSVPVKGPTENDEEKRRKAALDKLGNASKDSFLGHVSLSSRPASSTCSEFCFTFVTSLCM